MCYDEIGLFAQNMLAILGSIMTTHWEIPCSCINRLDYVLIIEAPNKVQSYAQREILCDHLKRKRTFIWPSYR